MIARKLLDLPNLTKTQAFCIHEATKIVLVSKDKHLVFAIFWIILPCFEDLNDGQKLTVVNLY